MAQIKLAAPNDEADEVDESETRLLETKAELERLREDVRITSQDSAPTLVAKGQPCPLPAEIPKLVEGMKISGWMRVLVSKLISTGKIRVGFFGMGAHCPSGSLPRNSITELCLNCTGSLHFFVVQLILR